MWLLFSLLAAIFYALLWVMKRASRGVLPAGIANSAQFWLGPPLLLIVPRSTPLPWDAPIWYAWIILVAVAAPLAAWGLTYAVQRSDLSIVKPLSGLSSLSALLVAFLLFGEVLPAEGIAGVLAVAVGFFVLYRDRGHHWRTIYPWIAMACVVYFGAIGAITRELFTIFPEPLYVSALFLTIAAVATLIASFMHSGCVHIGKKGALILCGFALFGIIQDIATAYAFFLAPAAYVYTVKRSSILLASVIGYFVFKEREATLWQIVLGSIIVIGGTAILGFVG